jgi:two-component system phosphate regulon response regulator PhoB
MQKTVLIVEDDSNLQSLYKQELEKAGFIIVQALSGQEALQQAVTHKPQLILLDVMLPGGMNGFEVLEKIRSDRDISKTKVIMMTNLQDEKTTAKSLGANGYFIKADTTVIELTKIVKKYLRSFPL